MSDQTHHTSGTGGYSSVLPEDASYDESSFTYGCDEFSESDASSCGSCDDGHLLQFLDLSPFPFLQSRSAGVFLD